MSDLNLLKTVEIDDYQLNQEFYLLFNQHGCCFSVDLNFNKKIYKNLEKSGYTICHKNLNIDFELSLHESRIWINKDRKILLMTTGDIHFSIAKILYALEEEKYIINFIKNLYKKCGYLFQINTTPQIDLLLMNESRRMYFDTFELKNLPLLLDCQYNDDFIPVYNHLVEWMNQENETGICLLHGLPGTGKTSIIRHLTTMTKKRVIYLPSHMVDTLSDPGFLNFMMRCRNSILVIEDAERALIQTGAGHRSPAVSNLLNLSDGILGDCVSMQIICTFNTDKTHIDQALLREGRLVAEYEFGKLKVEKVAKLLQELKMEIPERLEEMTLAEVYAKHKTIRVKNKTSKIGF